MESLGGQPIEDLKESIVTESQTLKPYMYSWPKRLNMSGGLTTKKSGSFTSEKTPSTTCMNQEIIIHSLHKTNLAGVLSVLVTNP